MTLSNRIRSRFKDNLNLCLKDLSMVSCVLERLEGQEQRDVFLAELAGEAQRVASSAPKFEDLPDLLVRASLPDGVEFTNPDLFQKCQDLAVSIFGEWDESAVSTALASYYLGGGGIIRKPIKVDLAETQSVCEDNDGAGEGANVPDETDQVELEGREVLTLGELYMLDESDPDFGALAGLTLAERDGLPDTEFAGPSKTFPVHTLQHAIASIELLGRALVTPNVREEIEETLRQVALYRYGLVVTWVEGDGKEEGGSGGVRESRCAFSPLIIYIEQDGVGETVPLMALKCSTTIQMLKECPEAVITAYMLEDDDAAAFKAYLDGIGPALEFLEGRRNSGDASVSPLFVLNQFAREDRPSLLPVRLGARFLLKFFQKSQEREKEEVKPLLTSLVAVKRELGLADSDICRMSRKYEVFSVSVLKLLLKADQGDANKSGHRLRQVSGHQPAGDPPDTPQVEPVVRSMFDRPQVSVADLGFRLRKAFRC